MAYLKSMERYIAFLRGINVSGQKIIKMEMLRTAASDAGFGDVKTYIQSGNLIFTSDENDENQLITKIEELIEVNFGFHTDVIVRKRSDITAIVNLPLFDPMKSDDEKKFYVTFLKNENSQDLEFPIFSKNREIELFQGNGREIFSVCTLYKGVYGFPNAFIEKLTGIPSTTRNPITLRKILEV